ncbi:phosphoribosylpyrophosphate synthetase [Algoriphagus sediminis]|uniref:Phosphoribosylpyrophosphate synthetase n=1 Tax=Algoriphagus sediminis TaxID=3057113 RepID=A0ABT7YA68_9BACT|nr:phosphoribosylpyrophosphate synthetase [Algoriphagus sediminis]MDN3203401.1 phosphoribosylpyrophosphate synthetase [Algoriphagus sediminis]
MLEHGYETLSQATNALTQHGYSAGFKAVENKMVNTTSKKEYLPEELKIIHTYRFEGMSNPQDDAVVFALEANDGAKGTLIMSHSSKHSQNVDLIKKIPEQKKD